MSSTAVHRIIRNATILSMDPAIGDLEGGDVLIEGRRIGAVGTNLAAPEGAEEIDGTGMIVVPGFVDTHRHMFQAVVRGSTPVDTLGDYFTRTLGQVAPALTPRDLYVGELLSARGALSAGVTTVQDISNIQDEPANADAIIDALRTSGLRAVFAYGKSFPAMGVEGSPLPDDVRRIRRDLLADDAALVTMALTTEPGDDDAERHNATLARELGVRTARHVSAAYPVTRLRELGVLLPGTTFIHANGMPDAELAAIADGGGSLSIAPAIEMMMGHGYPMFAAASRTGTPISLSVDVEVTCPADMFTQLRAGYQAARSREVADPDSSPGHYTVRDLLEFATIGGARALGLDTRIGSITPGKEADLLVLRADDPGVAPVVDPVSTVVLQMDRSHLDTVLVAGTVVKRAGRLVGDDTALIGEADDIVRRLRRDGIEHLTDRRRAHSGNPRNGHRV